MKLIPLSQGFFAKVDDEDYDILMKYKWCIKRISNCYYAKTSVYTKGKQKFYSMHRIIMKLNNPKIFVDHKDNDGLNNQKSNLRICTSGENMRNKRPKRNGSSKYLGVCWAVLKCKKKIADGSIKIYMYSAWMACIRINNKQKNIGYFKTEENAAIAYNILAEKHHGEFANYNKI